MFGVQKTSFWFSVFPEQGLVARRLQSDLGGRSLYPCPHSSLTEALNLMVLPAAWTNTLAALTISLPAACTMDSIPACCMDDPFAAADRICLLPGPMLSSVDHCTTKTAGNLFFTLYSEECILVYNWYVQYMLWVRNMKDLQQCLRLAGICVCNLCS